MQKSAIRAKKIIIFTHEYRYVLSGVIILLAFSATILYVNDLANIPMNLERYDKGLLDVKKLQFDEKAIEKINQLQKTSTDSKEDTGEKAN